MTIRQLHPNSLANLKIRSHIKKEGYGYKYCIPQEKVDELFSYLAQGMGLNDAAKEANIASDTARKYFKKGDPRRGIKPLMQRLTMFQSSINEKMNVLLEETRMERIQLVKDLIGKAKESIFNPQTFYDKEGNVIEVYDSNGKEIKAFNFQRFSILDIERLLKLETFLAGGVKFPVEENKMLTAEQIEGIPDGGDNNQGQ